MSYRVYQADDDEVVLNIALKMRVSPTRTVSNETCLMRYACPCERDNESCSTSPSRCASAPLGRSRPNETCLFVCVCVGGGECVCVCARARVFVLAMAHRVISLKVRATPRHVR